ncbi:hypothetical protein PSPO01_10027 [Paraphaeosphaeria sporulosa]
MAADDVVAIDGRWYQYLGSNGRILACRRVAAGRHGAASRMHSMTAVGHSHMQHVPKGCSNQERRGTADAGRQWGWCQAPGVHRDTLAASTAATASELAMSSDKAPRRPAWRCLSHGHRECQRRPPPRHAASAPTCRQAIHGLWLLTAASPTPAAV